MPDVSLFRRLLRSGAAIVLDLFAVALLAVVVFVATTGGDVFQIGGTTVSVTSARNPVLALALLMTLRWIALRHISFFRVPAWKLATADQRALDLCLWLYRSLTRMDGWRALTLVTALVSISLCVRLLNAYFFYGFFAGDDVEIHEMTLSTLFARNWDIWDLRSAYFPMVFIYPAQWLTAHVVSDEVRMLIFSGRAVVAVFSSATIGLLFAIGRRDYGVGPSFVAAFLLATNSLSVMMGSTELPRSVAAFFLVAGFGAALRQTSIAATLAGVCIAIAGAMRFSEVAFVVPCVAMMALEGRLRHTVLAIFGFGMALVGILGVADWLYWGEAFHSLTAAIDYGVVRGLSSRGYEPFYWYATNALTWSNLLLAVPGMLAFRFGGWRPALWGWLPLIALSLMTHKEARYALPSVPFLSLAAGVVLWRFFATLSGRPRGESRRRALTFAAIASATLLVEVASYRFERSEDAVDTAIAHRERWRRDGVAVEQLWRIGGRLYIPDVSVVREILPERLGEPGYVSAIVSDRTVGWILFVNRKDREPFVELPQGSFREVPGTASYRIFQRLEVEQ